MKKIDILNFITNFRKTPNEIKTHKELVEHIRIQHSTSLEEMLADLMKTGVLKETVKNGEKAYQVTKK